MPNTLTPTDEAALIAWVRQAAASGHGRAIRQKARLSQAEMGRALGVTHAAVNGWETGRRSPSGAVALRYGELLRTLERVSIP